MYNPNPESKEDMVAKLAERFQKRGVVMSPEQRNIYEKISEMVTGLTVIDIGCGTGIGTNILSQEARYVWGVDYDPQHIEFAKQMFARKNTSGMGQVEFEVLDLVKPPSRELSKFSVIVCVDVLEHIEDYQTALNTIKRFYDPGKTTLFLSTPNRNDAEKFPQDKPLNPHHVREWTIAEAYDIMIKNFQGVTCYSWDMETRIDLDSKITPVVFRAEGNLI
jgi:2-polyprenyl-3-methyl-5-hydroxy-6-metoxy-1,4-benzoquinol methylase